MDVADTHQIGHPWPLSHVWGFCVCQRGVDRSFTWNGNARKDRVLYQARRASVLEAFAAGSLPRHGPSV